jgi:hypothetical protein
MKKAPSLKDFGKELTAPVKPAALREKKILNFRPWDDGDWIRFRKLALDEGKSANDLLNEGMHLVFKKRGLPGLSVEKYTMV